MAIYKCSNCGHIFEGGLSTMSCPKCGSKNLAPEGMFLPNNFWKKVGILLGVLAGVAIFIYIIQEKTIVASLEENTSVGIFVRIDDVPEAYQNYLVEVYHDGVSCNTLYFDDNGTSGILRFETMEVGTYVFNLMRRDFAPFKYNWTDGRNSYTKKPDPEAPIIVARGIKANRATKTWKVQISLKNSESQSGVKYTLNNITQVDTIFDNISPGTYEVTARNDDNLVGTYTLILKEIKPLPAKLSVNEMNEIFAKVHNGSMGIGKARNMFSESGDVRLKKAIDGYSSLYDVLSFTRQNGAPQYEVISCNYDDDNQIIPGSLELRRK